MLSVCKECSLCELATSQEDDVRLSIARCGLLNRVGDLVVVKVRSIYVRNCVLRGLTVPARRVGDLCGDLGVMAGG